jgi:hypothetical protein
MNRKRLFQEMLCLMLTALLLAGCGGASPSPTATPTPVPPTATDQPTSTATPIEASMWCDVSSSLSGPAGDPAFRNPMTGLEAVVQGSNAVRNVAKISVEIPSGETFIIPPYGDIPYGSEGRFCCVSTQGLPQAGGTYTFTALDADGKPILGLGCTDVYFGGNEPAPPTNVQAEVVEAGILVTWDPSPVIPGAFEPNGSPTIGFYSIYFIREDGEVLYAWNSGQQPMPETSHLIPFRLQDFGPADAGLALEGMDDGIYYIMNTFSQGPEGIVGQNAEGVANDPSQNIRIVIESGQMRVEGP